MLFVVILLIGTGWTLIKSYLNDKDKKILLVVIPLQVLANIAMIVVGESSPGSQQWLTWVPSQTIDIFGFVINHTSVLLSKRKIDFSNWIQRDIFNIVDIICCAAILIPILWSIKHLRQAAQTDGKGTQIDFSFSLSNTFQSLWISLPSFFNYQSHSNSL
jgi:cell division protein FtsW (lipid II flippase)